MGSTDSMCKALDPTYPVVKRTGCDNHRANRLVHTRPAPSPNAVPISISVHTRSTSRSPAVLLSSAPGAVRHGHFGPHLHEIHGRGTGTGFCRAKVCSPGLLVETLEMFFQQSFHSLHSPGTAPTRTICSNHPFAWSARTCPQQAESGVISSPSYA